MKEDTMKKEDEHLLAFNKNKVTDMLDRRHKERQLHLDNLHTLKSKVHAASENQDYFMDIFLEKIREIELNLNNIQPDDVAILTKKFNKIAFSLQELQGYLSSSTLFLSEYSIKSSQRRIDHLLSQFDEVKIKWLPKKKFGFKTKQIPAAPDHIAKALNGDQLKKDNPLLLNSHIEWTIKDKINEEIVLQGGDVNNKDITISSLTNCLVQIVGYAGSLQMSNLENCFILCGPVARSVFAENCQHSKLIFGCQQFRLHSSQYCQIYMHVTSRAIIEDCTNISVAPYNYSYPQINDDFHQAGLDAMANNWQDVADFNWLVTDRASPNWKKICTEDQIADWQLAVDQFRQEFI